MVALNYGDCDLPTIKGVNGDKYWYKNGQWHRNNNLPAVEYNDGSKFWHKNDKEYLPFTNLIIIKTNKVLIKLRIKEIDNIDN